MERSLSRIKSRVYRVLWRPARLFHDPVDPRNSQTDFTEWFNTFDEIGYTQGSSIKSATEAGDKVKLDTGKQKAVGFKGRLELMLLQSGGEDYDFMRYMEGIESDILLYSQNSGVCLFYPAAIVSFKENTESGQVDGALLDYEAEELASRDNFRMRFDSTDGQGGPVFFFSSLVTSGVYNPSNLMQQKYGIDYVQPQSYYYKGTHERIYFVWATSLPNNNITTVTTCYVDYYDIATQTFHGHVDVGPTNTVSDYHNWPSVIVADSGHIIVAYDPQDDGGHNAGIMIMRSNNPEDISAFTQIGKIEESAGVVPQGAYPFLEKTSDGSLFCNFRAIRSLGGAHADAPRWRYISKSTDNGATWGYAKVILAVADNDTNLWAYGAPGYRKKDADMIMWLNNDKHYGYEKIHVLRSSDGINWRNEQNTFSKNIDSEGYITPDEYNANCLVDQVDSGGHVFVRSAAVSKSGNVYLIITRKMASDSEYEAYFMYVTNGQWVKEDIILPHSCMAEYLLISYNDYVFEFITENNSNYMLEVWRTEDKGKTWVKKRDLNRGTATDDITYGYIIQNYLDSDHIFINFENLDSSGDYATMEWWHYKKGDEIL